MIASISSKGQVTIPAAARKRLGLHPGSRVDFVLTNDERLEIVPVCESVRQLKGMVPPPKKALSLQDMEAAIAEGARK